MHTTSCSIYDEIKITSCSRDALKYVHVENAPGNSGITSVSSTVYCPAGYQNEVLRALVRTVLT